LAYVYIVKCRDGTLYTGYAEDLRSRLCKHNDGSGAKYTRARRPVTLAYVEYAKDRAAAQAREASIKAMTRGNKSALCDAWTIAGEPMPNAGHTPEK
jgi:putative endonuclease